MADPLSGITTSADGPLLGPAPAARVLVVDDNPNKLLALEAVLAPLGHPIDLASSGDDALRRLLAGDYAVILLDVRMSGIDGFETAELIRRRPRSERTPIIFVTAFGEAEADMSRGYALGAVDFIFAPIDPDVLRNKVTVFVDLFEKSEAIRRQAERLRVLETIEHRRRLELAESERRQAEARFATMLDIAGDAIIAIDGERRMVLFNRAAERTFACTAESAIGHSFDDLVSGLSDELPRIDAAPLRREVRARRATGEEFPAEVTVAPTPSGDDDLYTVILRDVSEQRAAAEKVRRLNAALDQRLRTGIDMVADLAASLDAGEVLGRFLLRAAAALVADHGTLLRIDPQRRDVTSSHELHHAHPYDRRARLEEQPLMRRALEEKTLVIASPFDATELPAAAAAWGEVVEHVAALPLMIGGDVSAILLLARRGDPAFGGEDLDMLQIIGNVAVAALRNAELFHQAEESSRAKSEFLNLAAHELRTPLSVVRGYASMLSDGTLGAPPPGWVRPVEVMNAKLAELNGLVNDLLTAARADAGRIVGRNAVFDIREVVEAAIERVSARARLESAELISELPAAPVLVVGDHEHTGRIIDNLLNNALTYSSGRPWLRVSVSAETGEVAVSDHGVGIPAASRERIFERFYRVNDRSLGPKPGTGLGLYISRALAELQDGTLRLERSGRDGSTFALQLPRAPSSMEDGGSQAQGRSAARDAELSGAAVPTPRGV